MQKPVFVILFMMVASVAAHAQIDTLEYEYCQMEVIGKLNGKAKISVDFGQYQSVFSKAYRDKVTGKVAQFNSPMDALNYMVSVESWSFVQAFTYQVDTGFGLYDQLYYLLRKPKNQTNK